MPSFKIAHLNEQGQDMIIVPLNEEFGRRPSLEQSAMTHEIYLRAQSAGLAGQVVPVWPEGVGRMCFIAPEPWHPFFRSLSLRQIAANLNKTLSW